MKGDPAEFALLIVTIKSFGPPPNTTTGTLNVSTRGIGIRQSGSRHGYTIGMVATLTDETVLRTACTNVASASAAGGSKANRSARKRVSSRAAAYSSIGLD